MFHFESPNEPDDEGDDEGLTAAYGFSIGEIVMYRELIQGRIVEFGRNADVVILPWDPDRNDYSGAPMRVAVNDCQ